MMGYYNDFMFGFGWIFMVFFWGLVVWGIIALVRGGRHNGCCGHDHDHDEHGRRDHDALAILKERYAKGEITKKQFEETKKDLGE